VAGSLFLTLLLTIYGFGFRQPNSSLNFVQTNNTSDRSVSEHAGMGREIFVHTYHNWRGRA
jgi:hypothetical protein